MSEPKLISPLLDNFIMGEPISDLHGVRVCPAMRQDTEAKYIVKIISSPATSAQLDALLLSGAYTDRTEALAYYKQVADSIMQETEILDKLSTLDGFVSYKGCQQIESEDASGYDVYLLSPYRRSLARILSKESMTHLGALNLGLDLCAALSLSRRSGYLYAALTPENIYIVPDQGYKIGDIGFIKLDSLKYASLPDRYRSPYTAPEIADAYATLNATIDVYAVGLILYQVFNAGVLPECSGVPLPPPDYADYEMSEIILRACAPDPADRWEDPAQMGQALVGYMQRNGAHDLPIIPVVATESEQTDTADSEEPPDVQEANDATEDASAQLDAATQPTSDEFAESGQDAAVLNDSLAAEESVPVNDFEPSASAYTEDDFGNLSFLSDSEDETLPGEETSDMDYEQISVEVSDILNQADELIAHPTPDPVVAPEPIEISIPAPICTSEESKETETEQDAVVDTSPEDVVNKTPDEDGAVEPSDDDNDPPAEESDDPQAEASKKPKSHWLRNTILVVLLLALIGFGVFYYKSYYLQNIDSLTLSGSDLSLTVYVETDADESLLSILCFDTYGNQLQAPVVDGKATFDALAPDCAYSVEVVISGFHALTGETRDAYATPARTNVAQFSAVTGAEDGSVILGFTLEGPDIENWIVRYSAKDGQSQEVSFSGHMYTFTGLTVGTEYTFELLPAEEQTITGTTTVTYVVSKLISANGLRIAGFTTDALSISWDAPEEGTVSGWTVHCYNDKGFDQTVVTEQTEAVFEGIALTDAYTVEVTAAGMSVSERVFIPENSVSISDLSVSSTDGRGLNLSWKNGSATSSDGWVLRYSVDGSTTHEINVTEGTSVYVTPYIPDSTYSFSLLTASGENIIGGSVNFTTDTAVDFSGYGATADTMTFNMCRTPDYSGWDRYDLSSSDYTTDYEVGEAASFLVRLHNEYDISSDEIVTSYVIRNTDGTVVSISSKTGTWSSLWYRNYGEFDIPALPTTAGSYVVTVYFNGAFAGEENFRIR